MHPEVLPVTLWLCSFRPVVAKDVMAGNMMEEAADLLEAKRGRDGTPISLMPSRPDGGLIFLPLGSPSPARTGHRDFSRWGLGMESIQD